MDPDLGRPDLDLEPEASEYLIDTVLKPEVLIYVVFHELDALGYGGLR